MPKLIFDIETRGFNSKELDPIIKENLIKSAKSDGEREDILERTGLYPVSGEIVAIAMLNAETNKGRVYFQAPALSNQNMPDNSLNNYKKSGLEYIVADEKEILENFWNDVQHYNQIITFNGRGFDCPFIIFRSIIHNIRPTRNLMPNRYYTNEHLDLMDQLSYYGAFRKFSLEVMCQLFNIRNPKDEGVSGLTVNHLFKQGEYKKIAEYCMRDVIATKELYNRVRNFLS